MSLDTQISNVLAQMPLTDELVNMKSSLDNSILSTFPQEAEFTEVPNNPRFPMTRAGTLFFLRIFTFRLRSIGEVVINIEYISNKNVAENAYRNPPNLNNKSPNGSLFKFGLNIKGIGLGNVKANIVADRKGLEALPIPLKRVASRSFSFSLYRPEAKKARGEGRFLK